MQALMASKPPFPAWTESLLETWYQLPPRAAYDAVQQGQKPQTGEGGGHPGGGKSPTMPTVADRRELAVREQR